MIRTTLVAPALVVALAVFGGASSGQTPASLDLALVIDYQSAARTIETYQGFGGSPGEVAAMRGSQVALATTAMLAGRPLGTALLEKHLQAARYNQRLEDDPFQMIPARASATAMKDLLVELQRRNFGQRVVSTVEQLFPADARVRSRIPMFFVAFGPQTIDAFVRRVVWDGDAPRFVGEGEGELTIVVNLAHAVSYGASTDERFIGVLSVVAHEVFHAAFGAYKDASPAWRQYYATHTSAFDAMLDLAQNEGIAYYLSLIQRTRGRLSADWEQRVRASFEQFNRNAEELLSPSITQGRANEIIRRANTAGYWESYGSMAGMVIARQIDQTFGREALSSTIAQGPQAFFRAYLQVMQRDGTVPPLSPALQRAVR